MASAAPAPLEQCATTATVVCGQGNVCCLCVTGEPASCSFSCRGAEGDCQPCPPCARQGFLENEYVAEDVAPGIRWVVGPQELWLVVLHREPWAVQVW